jgi:hypothetical protein
MNYCFKKTPVLGCLLTGVFLLIMGCTSTKVPIWIQNEHRANSEYYHGFSKVSKTGSAEEYMEIARTHSLGIIAQLIKSEVQVTTESKTKEFEVYGKNATYNLSKSFELVSSSRTKMSLEGVEHVGEWEDDSHYFVYNRLSKKLYESILNKKIAKALESAKHNLEIGTNLMSTNPVQSLYFFMSGLKSLLPFQDQILIVSDPIIPKSSINIDLVLMKKIKNLISEISLLPVQKKIKSKNVQTHLPSITLEATHKQNNKTVPLNNLPVLFEFSIGSGSIHTRLLTGENGIIDNKIQNFEDQKEIYQIKAKLDLISFTGTDELGMYLYSELSRNAIPLTFVDIEIIPFSIYLNSEERILGQLIEIPLVTPIIIKSLKRRTGAIFVKDQNLSDFTLDIKIDTQKKGVAFSLYSSVAQMNLYCKQGEDVLFAENINDVKGTHRDYKLASREAIKKLADKFENEISIQISNQILN